MFFKELLNKFEDALLTTKSIEKTYVVYSILNDITNKAFSKEGTNQNDDAKDYKKELDYSIRFMQGKIFLGNEINKINISNQLIISCLAKISNYSEKEIETMLKEIGDLGLVSEKILEKKTQKTLFSMTNLTIVDVYDDLYKISKTNGIGSNDYKISILSKLLLNSSPIEAKYIVKLILEQLRIGIGQGIIRDAIIHIVFPKIVSKNDTSSASWKFCKHCSKLSINYSFCLNCRKELSGFESENGILEFSIKNDLRIKTLSDDEFNLISNEKKISLLEGIDLVFFDDARKLFLVFQEIIDEKYSYLNDYYELIKISKKSLSSLMDISIDYFKPVKSMLFYKVDSIDDAFSEVGNPCCVEYKYDGFRIQAHKFNDDVKLYTRNLEDVSNSFPDLTDELKKINSNFIFDGELLLIDENGKSKPFQELSKRIKRKYHILEKSKESQIKYFVFDILKKNDLNTNYCEFEKRREILDNLFKEEDFCKINKKVILSDYFLIDNADDAKKYFDKSLFLGNEGLMFKNLHSVYVPGRKVGTGVKLKSVLDPLDLVVVKATWGEGKRNNLLTSFTLACMSKNDELLEIGKVSTGIKELKETELDITYADITQILTENIISKTSEKEIIVKPILIMEVNYEEIQKSNNYNSGYALRFPRFIRIRQKQLNEIAHLSDIKNIYQKQRGRVE